MKEVHAETSIEDRLSNIESLLGVLVERQQVREYYSVEEFARIVGRAPFTVRGWARHGRITASRKASGRGAYASYAISHEELLRFQREGLLPVRRPP
jgi:Helix-turn-helix domain